MFSSIRSYGKINKLHERSLCLCHNDYTSIQQLMIEISKCLKGISPPIINEIYRRRNIPHTTRNPRDLVSGLPKTVYCGLETIAYKGLQLWQQLPTKIKISSSLLSVKQNVKLSKNTECTCRLCKTHIGGLSFGIHINKTRRANLLYFYYSLLLLIIIIFLLFIIIILTI